MPHLDLYVFWMCRRWEGGGMKGSAWWTERRLDATPQFVTQPASPAGTGFGFDLPLPSPSGTQPASPAGTGFGFELPPLGAE